MPNNFYRLIVVCLLGLFLVACDHDDTDPIIVTVPKTEPDLFFTYPNRQASLPAGNYQLLAGQTTSKLSNYHMKITYDDGFHQSYSGQWNAFSNVQNSFNGAAQFDVKLLEAGGLDVHIISESDVAIELRDSNGRKLFNSLEDNNSQPEHLIIPASRIDNPAFSEAYYRAVDPFNEKDTLSKWKSANGFDNGVTHHVKFQDWRDLGYGRNLFVRKNSDGSAAFFVENYQVDVLPGFAYGPLNLEALINEDRQYHFGTNAIEFHPGENGEAGVLKFYTFTPDPLNPQEAYRNSIVDLDKRGDKAFPMPCLGCHGGSLYPLDQNGDFQPLNKLNAALQPLDVDTFRYSDLPGWTMMDQEAELKAINKIIYDTYPKNIDSLQGNSFAGEYLSEILAGAYGGDEFPEDTYQAGFVPVGWRSDPDDNNPPVGAEELYLSVIEPYCMVCHAKQGTRTNSVLDFGSYEKFLVVEDEITRMVYDRGMMPMGLRQYDTFWAGQAPEILASFLPGFDRRNGRGELLKPGRPIAEAGEDRNVGSESILDASSSYFVKAYEWQLASAPANGEVVFENDTAVRTKISFSRDGIYTFKLLATGFNGKPAVDTVNLTVNMNNNTMDLTFVADIQPILNENCVTCHHAAATDVPVVYDASTNPNVYEDIIARIDLEEPVESRILVKPQGINHFGGLRPGFDLSNPDNRHNYETILNWIYAGALKE